MQWNELRCVHVCDIVKGKADGPRGKYESWDLNMDGKITIDEVIKLLLSLENPRICVIHCDMRPLKVVHAFKLQIKID